MRSRSELAALGISLPGEEVPGQAQADYLVDRLIARMLQQALPVREQAHHAPPFNSRPILFRYRQQHNLTNVAPPNLPALVDVVPVCWNPQAQDSTFTNVMSFNASSTFIAAEIPEPVPTGLIAVVYPSVQCWQNEHDAVFAMSMARWTFEVNEAVHPSFAFLYPGGTEFTNDDNAAGAVHPHGGLTRDVVPRAPVVLRSGDRARIKLWDTIDAGAPTNVMFDVLVEGYLFQERARQLAAVDMNVE